MEPIVVSNQAEYIEACKAYRDILDNGNFDIDAGKGVNIVKKVDSLITDYLFKDISKNEAEKSLSRLCFNEYQAKEITGFFVTHRPGDLYEIEQGLNILGLQNSGKLNRYISLIHIKNGAERITVKNPVEVFGKSEVAAYRYAHVAAHGKASITAFNQAVVYALDSSNVLAADQSHVVTKDMPHIVAWDSAIVNANDQAVVIARDKAIVTANNNALVFLQNDAVCKRYDNAKVIARSQNKPDLLENNVFHILDHPFIKGNAAIAVNLLITSADPKDIDAFSQKLKGMGCVDPESTKKVLQSLAGKTNPAVDIVKNRDSSWER
jgi:hypothetical protein